MEGFSEDVDVAQIKREPTHMIWAAVIARARARARARRAGGADLVLHRPRAAGRAQPLRPEPRAEGAQALRASSSPRTSTCSRRRSAPATASRARWASSPTRRRSPRSASTARVVTDEQLGIPLDEALEVTAKRMQNPDLDQVAVLALVQREAGGNTAEVLDQVIANIRARMDIRRLVDVLTARASSRAGSSRPSRSASSSSSCFVNPSHLDPLFHDPLGQVAGICVDRDGRCSASG